MEQLNKFFFDRMMISRATLARVLKAILASSARRKNPAVWQSPVKRALATTTQCARTIQVPETSRASAVAATLVPTAPARSILAPPILVRTVPIVLHWNAAASSASVRPDGKANSATKWLTTAPIDPVYSVPTVPIWSTISAAIVPVDSQANAANARLTSAIRHRASTASASTAISHTFVSATQVWLSLHQINYTKCQQYLNDPFPPPFPQRLDINYENRLNLTRCVLFPYLISNHIESF